MNCIIDFKELVSLVKGEGLEQLIRLLGKRMGLQPTWTGPGADHGNFEDISGTISNHKIRWLVSCKDKSKSGKSVNESDLPSPGILDKVKQHKADGFLLITTTTVGTAAKELIDKQDKSNNGEIYTKVWDVAELSAMLLEEPNHDLLLQYLPESYKRVKEIEELFDRI